MGVLEVLRSNTYPPENMTVLWPHMVLYQEVCLCQGTLDVIAAPIGGAVKP